MRIMLLIQRNVKLIYDSQKKLRSASPERTSQLRMAARLRPRDTDLPAKALIGSLSLHVAFNVNLPGRQDRGPHTPDLPRVDPRIRLGGGGKTDVRKQIDDRLAAARCGLAIAGQRNPLAVVRL